MEDNYYVKKGSNGVLYLILVLVMLISIGLLGYTYFYMSNPKNIYTNLVNNTFDSIIVKDEENIKLKYNLSVSVEGSEIDEDTVNLLNSLKLSGISYLTKKDKYAVYNAKISNSDGNLFDITMSYKDKNVYFGLGDLFDKNIRVELDSEKSDEIDEMFKNYNVESYKKIVNEFRNAFLNAIGDEVIVQESEVININDKEKKVNNNKLEINNINYSDIRDKFVDYLISSDDFIDNVMELTNQTKQEVLERIDSIDKNLSSDESIVINVYTDGLMNKFVGIKCVYINSDEEVTFSYNDSEFKISSNGGLVSIKEESENNYSFEIIEIEDDLKIGFKGNFGLSYEEYSMPNTDNSVLVTELTEGDLSTIMDNLSKNEAIANIVNNYVYGDDFIEYEESEISDY